VKFSPVITLLVAVVFAGAALQTATTRAQVPTPRASTTSRVMVRVVYDVNNDGALDAEDTPLTGRAAVLTPASGQGSPITAGEGSETDLPAGTYTVFATGPRYLPGEEGTPGAICRGWRTSYIVGAPLSKTADQPAPGLGFTVDLPAVNAASSPAEIVLGLSDKGQKSTEFADVQILCPESGAAASLPGTGAGQGSPSNWPRLLLAVSLLLGLAAVSVTRLARRRT
jgi:hypothetical protein